jgi:hypothetical protein
LEKTTDLSEIIKEISGLEVGAVKLFTKNRGFEVMCEISCVLEGEDIVGSEEMKELSVSDIM